MKTNSDLCFVLWVLKTNRFSKVQKLLSSHTCLIWLKPLYATADQYNNITKLNLFSVFISEFVKFIKIPGLLSTWNSLFKGLHFHYQIQGHKGANDRVFYYRDQTIS